MTKKSSAPPPLQLREFRSPEEIDAAIGKFQRRIKELEELDVQAAVLNHTGADDVVRSNIKTTILEVFGVDSPEFREHQYIRIWAGDEFIDMNEHYLVQGTERGRAHVITILKGLIGRLEEKKAEFGIGAAAAPSSYFDRLNLHPRISDVARDRFMDGHHWDAVFAASKALVNFVKERSNRHDLDGTSLVRAVFSKNSPVLAFNDVADQTDLDEQEGMMHLFEGAVMAIRNPGGHSFPEGSEQRAIECISFLSMLAYRVQEALDYDVGCLHADSDRPQRRFEEKSAEAGRTRAWIVVRDSIVVFID
jgi:uncharacterized protein (TIGR02391 family)